MHLEQIPCQQPVSYHSWRHSSYENAGWSLLIMYMYSVLEHWKIFCMLLPNSQWAQRYQAWRWSSFWIAIIEAISILECAQVGMSSLLSVTLLGGVNYHSIVTIAIPLYKHTGMRHLWHWSVIPDFVIFYSAQVGTIFCTTEHTPPHDWPQVYRFECKRQMHKCFQPGRSCMHPTCILWCRVCMGQNAKYEHIFEEMFVSCPPVRLGGVHSMNR